MADRKHRIEEEENHPDDDVEDNNPSKDVDYAVKLPV